ncbi:MAG: hypothetical protein CL908_26775 [Deltaproteobacteria bacterium]|jgi:hypothetical protein|nr:hypothetical protein [Deltaproteobacteria bacterium]
MEKLIYVMVGGGGDVSERLPRIAEQAVPAAREMGGESMAVLVPDKIDEIRRRCPARIGGDFDSFSAVFEVWLPTLDPRARIEEALRPLGDSLWGYLVSESSMAPCPHDPGEGGRVPGITQWGINDKPADVALEDFYREWAVHSKLSFDLHPTRESYIRNAVARRLTPEAPSYLGIVLERFPSLDHFTDESIYFGDPAVVKQMSEHVPSFYDFDSAITGGMSEYRFR